MGPPQHPVEEHGAPNALATPSLSLRFSLQKYQRSHSRNSAESADSGESGNSAQHVLRPRSAAPAAATRLRRRLRRRAVRRPPQYRPIRPYLCGIQRLLHTLAQYLLRKGANSASRPLP
jgi:hypothetical protein